MKHTLYHLARLKPVSTCARLQHWHYCCILCCFTRMRAHSPAQCAVIKKKTEEERNRHTRNTYPALSCNHQIYRSPWGAMCQRKHRPCLQRCGGMRAREKDGVCVSVCVRERERRQSRGASEWETRERDRGSNVSATSFAVILLAECTGCSWCHQSVSPTDCRAGGGEERGEQKENTW